MKDTPLIEILRIRNFLEHDNKQITDIESEFTLKSNKNDLENIFLTVNSFLPNLKILDSEGVEYPIMSNTDTKILLKIMQEENKVLGIRELIESVENHETFLIWIKIPPNKRLKQNEIRILHLHFEIRKTNRRFGNRIFLDISSDLPFPVFWIFKKPKDYKIADQYWYTVKNKGLTNKKSWKHNKRDVFYYDDTVHAAILLVKANQKNIIISYSFKAKVAIVALPVSAIFLLTSFALFLIAVQHHVVYGDGTPPVLFENLLERKIELSLFIISFSLIIPRLITNIEIRHSLFWWYFVPISMTLIFFMLEIGFN